MCNKCLKELRYPLINKKEEIDVPEKPESFLERRNAERSFVTRIPSFEKREEDENLKSLIKQNHKVSPQKIKEKRDDLVENFHWKVMRTRRYKCVSQDQMAKELGISSNEVAMVEKGILPPNDYEVLRKIEAYLGIKLIKSDNLDKVKESFVEDGELKVDKVSSKFLTISDIKNLLHKKKDPVQEQRKILGAPQENVEESGLDIGRMGDVDESGELKSTPLEEMSEEEIRKMIYGN